MQKMISLNVLPNILLICIYSSLTVLGGFPSVFFDFNCRRGIQV